MAGIPEPVRPGRLDSLTGLRWWAAFAVFAYHMANLAPLPIAGYLAYGDYGVTFFFVLSGFVLTWSARPGMRPQTFWLRRFARIYPSHFVALVLAIPVFYSFTPAAADPWVKPVDFGILSLSLVVLQGWWRDPLILFSGNPAAWTLTCEAFFYALHPAFNRVLGLLSRRGTWIALTGVVAAAFAYRAAVVLWPNSGLQQLPWPLLTLTEFALGMCVARALSLGWRFRVPPFVVYLIGAAFIVALKLTEAAPDATLFSKVLHRASNEWSILLCALIIAAVATNDIRRGFSLMRSRVMVFLGNLSYSFYLVHATVLYAVLAATGFQPPRWRNLLWYAALLLASTALAAALHYFVERPCERWLRTWWDRREERRVSRAIETTAPAPLD